MNVSAKRESSKPSSATISMQKPSNQDEEKKVDNNNNNNNENPGVCKATQDYLEKRKLYYIEKTEPLTDEHRKMYNELRLYVDSVISKKTPWVLSSLPPQLLALIDDNNNNKNNEKKENKNNEEKEEKHATAEMYSYLASYATESTLIRGITGSDYRLEIAKTALLETVQWRVSSSVDSISPEMFEKAIETKVIHSMNQRDKKGHLICYFKVLETPPDDPWVIVRAAIWFLEKGVKMAEQRGVYQIMWLCDIEHLKYATVPPLQILKQIAHILQYYYPERLYRAYILFSPWVFRMVWKMISGLLTENTKGKIIVPGWYESAKYETFQENIDKICLNKRFGGDADTEYSYKWELEQFKKTNNYQKI